MTGSLRQQPVKNCCIHVVDDGDGVSTVTQHVELYGYVNGEAVPIEEGSQLPNVGTCGFFHEQNPQDGGGPRLEHSDDTHNVLGQKHGVCKYIMSCKRKEVGDG
jgi:hypothetical protein